MSTQYSAVFGCGFVIDPDDLETVAKKFIDVDDDEAMDEFMPNAGDYLEPYVATYLVDLGLKVEMSYNLNWNSQATYFIGVNFVDDFEPWGGPMPQVVAATPLQREALQDMIEDLGLPSDTFIGAVYGLTVG